MDFNSLYTFNKIFQCVFTYGCSRNCLFIVIKLCIKKDDSVIGLRTMLLDVNVGEAISV